MFASADLRPCFLCISNMYMEHILTSIVTPTILMLQPGYQKVNIVRSFSTPVFVNKLESFRKDGSDRKGFVLLRLASPRIHRVQPSLENESARAINHHTSPQFDAEKG